MYGYFFKGKKRVTNTMKLTNVERDDLKIQIVLSDI